MSARKTVGISIAVLEPLLKEKNEYKRQGVNVTLGSLVEREITRAQKSRRKK